jgi:lysozyme
MGYKELNSQSEKLIKSFEGLRLKSYVCSAGKRTIGWGHTGNVPDEITLDQAQAFFNEDIQRFENCVNKHVEVDLTDNQFGALVSLCYNIGCKNFKNSTLLRLLNKGFYEQVPAQIMRWKFIHGVESAGLHKRRIDEVNLWRKDDEKHT